MEVKKINGFPPVNCQPLLENVSKIEAQPIPIFKKDRKIEKTKGLNFLA